MSEQQEPGSDRVTVSMPRGYKSRLEEAVAGGAASSVSALVTAAVDEHLARERTHRWIMDRRGGRPISPEALAWARGALGVPDEVPGQVSA